MASTTVSNSYASCLISSSVRWAGLVVLAACVLETGDLAGWSILLAVVFGVLAAGRYGLELWFRHRFHD